MNINIKKMFGRDEDEVYWNFHKQGKLLDPFFLVHDFQLKNALTRGGFQDNNSVSFVRKMFEDISKSYAKVGPTKRGAGDLTITFKFPRDDERAKVVLKYDAYDLDGLDFREEWREGIELTEEEMTNMPEILAVLYKEVFNAVCGEK